MDDDSSDDFPYFDAERGSSSGWSGAGGFSKDRVHHLDESAKPSSLTKELHRKFAVGHGLTGFI